MSALSDVIFERPNQTRLANAGITAEENDVPYTLLDLRPTLL